MDLSVSSEKALVPGPQRYQHMLKSLIYNSIVPHRIYAHHPTCFISHV